jgi:hypothetical protein
VREGTTSPVPSIFSKVWKAFGAVGMLSLAAQSASVCSPNTPDSTVYPSTRNCVRCASVTQLRAIISPHPSLPRAVDEHLRVHTPHCTAQPSPHCWLPVVAS